MQMSRLHLLQILRATRGRRNGGCAAGWTLVIIYESPTLPSKFISVFDGYAGVQGSDQLNIPISGFRTLPSLFSQCKGGYRQKEI
jgi:hypothetical protein